MRRAPECGFCFAPMGDGDSQRLGHDVFCQRCFDAILYAELGDGLQALGEFIERRNQ
jgi:hypothetical protein